VDSSLNFFRTGNGGEQKRMKEELPPSFLRWRLNLLDPYAQEEENYRLIPPELVIGKDLRSRPQ